MYYGIERNLRLTGKLPDGHLCNPDRKHPQCTAMKRTFFLQYQWFPFYMAILGFIYYFPYIVFRKVNNDIVSLKNVIKGGNTDITSLVSSYFNHQINSPTRMRVRVLANLLVKMLYILSNVLAFKLTDSLLNGRFHGYGSAWISWSKQTNEEAYTYATYRTNPKPGNQLLPSFGICEVMSLSQDLIKSHGNEHIFVCEISQHILYQYVLAVLWFCFAIGMVISSLGVVLKLVDHVFTVACFLSQGSVAKRVYKLLTLRECEYLEFIRKRNMALYGDLMRALKTQRLDSTTYSNDPTPLATSSCNGDYHQEKLNHPYQSSQRLLQEMQNQ